MSNTVAPKGIKVRCATTTPLHSATENDYRIVLILKISRDFAMNVTHQSHGSAEQLHTHCAEKSQSLPLHVFAKCL